MLLQVTCGIIECSRMLVQIETQNYGNGITDKEIGISLRYFISYAIQIFHKYTDTRSNCNIVQKPSRNLEPRFNLNRKIPEWLLELKIEPIFRITFTR